MSFFYKFLAWEKCTQNHPKPILGGSASRAVVLGRVFRAVLQVLDKFLQNYSTRLAPPSKDGVGGSECA